LLELGLLLILGGGYLCKAFKELLLRLSCHLRWPRVHKIARADIHRVGMLLLSWRLELQGVGCRFLVLHLVLSLLLLLGELLLKHQFLLVLFLILLIWIWLLLVIWGRVLIVQALIHVGIWLHFIL
jgi:hypothetical protein